jgi:hypothetical protein
MRIYMYPHITTSHHFFNIQASAPNYFQLLPPRSLQHASVSCHLNVLAHHGNHEIEKTNGLDESETQNGVGEELATHAWVAGNGHEESSEDHTDTDTGTTETDGGGTHTNVLGDLDHGGGDLRGETAGLAGGHHVAGGMLEDGGGLLTLEGLESGGAGRDTCEGVDVSAGRPIEE